MRIGLITDTHIPDVAKELPPEVNEVFDGVDLILHAGDLYSPSVLDDLERIAPVRAALGDDDSPLLLLDERVKNKHVLKLEDYTIWLIHEPRWPDLLPDQQRGDTSHIVVHGHIHEARVQKHDGVLFVGSGSPTFLRYQRGLGTVALLDIGSEGANVNIVTLSNGRTVR